VFEWSGRGERRGRIPRRDRQRRHRGRDTEGTRRTKRKRDSSLRRLRLPATPETPTKSRHHRLPPPDVPSTYGRNPNASIRQETRARPNSRSILHADFGFAVPHFDHLQYTFKQFLNLRLRRQLRRQNFLQIKVRKSAIRDSRRQQFRSSPKHRSDRRISSKPSGAAPP